MPRVLTKTENGPSRALSAKKYALMAPQGIVQFTTDCIRYLSVHLQVRGMSARIPHPVPTPIIFVPHCHT